MKRIALKEIERHYTNNGQHAEQVARFTLTGEIVKADNKPFTAGGDCGDIQIKSARATICKGENLEAHLAIDGAKRYGYVTADFGTMFLMTKAEYADFAKAFGTVTRDSMKNGGQIKMRFAKEGRAMMAWLNERA